MDEKIVCRKGQVAIWVILAVILVASIILFFALTREAIIVKPPQADVSFDMQSFLTECTTEHVTEVVDVMLPQGGFVQPVNTVFFNNTNIEYLCQNIGFYAPCIHQHPMLLNEMKKEIEVYVRPRLANCFDEMEREFKNRGADVDFESDMLVKVDFAPDRVLLYIKKEGTITKKGETRIFEDFNIEVQSPLYDLATIAMEIADQEATYCYFEFVGYNIFYPKYKVNKYQMSEPTKIYTITDKRSGKEMNIAIRSCALPPGI